MMALSRWAGVHWQQQVNTPPKPLPEATTSADLVNGPTLIPSFLPLPAMPIQVYASSKVIPCHVSLPFDSKLQSYCHWMEWAFATQCHFQNGLHASTTHRKQKKGCKRAQDTLNIGTTKEIICSWSGKIKCRHTQRSRILKLKQV